MQVGYDNGPICDQIELAKCAALHASNPKPEERSPWRERGKFLAWAALALAVLGLIVGCFVG